MTGVYDEVAEWVADRVVDCLRESGDEVTDDLLEDLVDECLWQEMEDLRESVENRITSIYDMIDEKLRKTEE